MDQDNEFLQEELTRLEQTLQTETETREKVETVLAHAAHALQSALTVNTSLVCWRVCLTFVCGDRLV